MLKTDGNVINYYEDFIFAEIVQVQLDSSLDV